MRAYWPIAPAIWRALSSKHRKARALRTRARHYSPRARAKKKQARKQARWSRIHT